MTVMPANHERPLSRNLHMAAIGAWLLIGLCAALAQTSPASASEQASSNTPHPALADCKSEWNDSSAEATCKNATFDTEPGNCVVTAYCKRAQRYDHMAIAPQGCDMVLIWPPVAETMYYYQWCTSTVKFPLTTTDVANCDGTLKAPSC